jgi:hypothetical protein
MRSAADRKQDQVRDRQESSDSAKVSQAPLTVSSTPGYGPGDEVMVLDDVTPLSASWMASLAEHDLRLVEALLAVLKAKRTDNSIKKISAQISDDLEWDDHKG